MNSTAIALLIVSLAAAGVGALSSSFLPAKETVPTSAKPVETTAAKLIDLPPVVTNLAASRDVWIRFEASIVVDPKAAPHLEALESELTNDILAYLRTLTTAQIEGPAGLQFLRESLNERAAIRSQGLVTELVIRTLVVQ